MRRHNSGALCVFGLLVTLAAPARPVLAQTTTTGEPATREAAIEQAEAEKSKDLHPYVPTRGEQLMGKVDAILAGTVNTWHPFFENADYGAGFTLGVGYAHHVSPYNMVDVRGSYTILGYKLVEAEFTAPRLFHRRGALSVVGGWREATQSAFYGLGMDSSLNSRTNYDYRQPSASATLTLWPTRRLLMLRGGLELFQRSQRPGEGSFPSVEKVYTPRTLTGLGATPTYVHSQGTVGFDWRTSPGYARRGGFYGVTLHDYTDKDAVFGFRRADYEAVQHFPILREAWVISLRARAQTVYNKSNQQIPFFMLPYLGSGHSLRGFISHRFRDQNSLLLQAEWRIMANRFMDTAVFYDAGKVAARKEDLDFSELKSDYGFGFRVHGPLSTQLRVEVARSREGTRLVLGASPIF